SCAMASTLAVLLLLSAGLFTVKAGFGENCESYYTIYNEYRPGFKCFFQYCCGNCDNRFCCLSEHLKLTESPDGEQIFCAFSFLGRTGLVKLNYTLISVLFFSPSAVAGAHVTTVTNTHFIQQQPVMQGAQCPQYQPVPTQPGYGQPMQTGPYQGQPYAPGPPPSCQAMYPMQPPAQPGVAYMPSQTSNQLAYNPAYVQPPNIGY
uniref:Shisa N-terminal domain-containing protein n=1 Tax=Sinocyclocheilus rhinocerous TaxID=307959 RepID=A0A673HMX4_9TELE